LVHSAVAVRFRTVEDPMTATNTERQPTRDGMQPLTHLPELAEYATEGVFLRFSKGPMADRRSVSRDHESGLELPGLSVVPLWPQPWWRRPLEDWLARQVCKYLHLRENADDERYGWLLRGDVVARGPDDEPLVTDVEPLVWLSEPLLDEARHRYRAHFDVGRDSTGA
jgi:hypothetical protein